MAAHLLAVADNLRTILLLSALFLVLLVIGFVVVAAVRKHFREDPAAGPGANFGFTLQQLRQMRRDGEINDEQYAKLREHVIGRAHSAEAQPPEAERPDAAAGKPDLPRQRPEDDGNGGETDKPAG